MEPAKSLLLICSIVLVLYNTHLVHCSNILVILPYASTSHYNVIKLILYELTKRGHNMTVISAFVEKNETKFNRHIKVDAVHPLEYYPEDRRPTMYNLFDSKSIFEIQDILRYSFSFITNKTLHSPEVKRFIKNDKSSFDLIIAEDFYFNAYYMFAHKYKAPLVTFASSASTHYINKYMGNSMQLEYVPHEFLHFFESFTFKQKIFNFAFSIIDLIKREVMITDVHNQIAAEHFQDIPQPLPDVKAIENNVSLVLINSHFSIDTVKSYPPNIVDIGGAHIRPVEKLPKDLQTILDNAEHGVVYVSFGSLIKSSELPQEKIDVFLNTFSSMKQVILWKWENDDLPNKPNNVFIRKWLPQVDILSHPNVCLFITHGGFLSLQETLYHGVPVVGMPIITDQHLNIARAIVMGFGEKIDYDTLTVNSLLSVVDKVLYDPSYTTNVREISLKFRDTPQSPLETAVFWIEYVIRHKGAKHLGLPSRNMQWWEYYLLDFISFVVITTALFIVLSYVFVKKLISIASNFNSKMNFIKLKKM